MIDRLHGMQYVSKIDLRQAYEQVLLKEEDRHKAAFRRRYGSFQPNVMTFGLSEAPATFTSLMTHIFRPRLDNFISVYLDAILVYSKTLDDHVQHLRTTLLILRDLNCVPSLRSVTSSSRMWNSLATLLEKAACK
jgi:Reverse transcriptase (RNA-dependent DNA polymerase)